MVSFNKLISLIPITIIAIPALASCGGNNNPQDGTIYLKVLNSEDYIYKYDEEDAKKGGNPNPDMIVQFEQYMEKKGQKVRVIYDTFDTMENMYNTLKTGKTKYDLICASEYMIQKLAKEVVNDKPLIQKLNKESIPNYFNDNYKFGSEDEGFDYSYGCSPFIRNKLKSMPAVAGTEAIEGNRMDDYVVCYMWGTLGILYNPEYDLLKSRGLTPDQIANDMTDWDSLWDSKYKKAIAIKDSMRDTYCIGLMHKYKDLLNQAKTIEEKNTIFNYGGEADPDYKKHINEVKDELLTLRKNVFGFEVDSGKQDIVTGKIGIDTAWSGDAVYSMDQGDEEKSARLYYSIPTEGTNLWFDCWAMQTGANVEVANEFLNFISDPINANQNMGYIGYTSPIAGIGTFAYFDETYSEDEGELYDVSYFYNADGEEEKHGFIIPESEIHRQISAQFPLAELEKNNKLMIMQDYGTHNDDILTMWEQVKHESLPIWAVILISVEAALVAAGITWVVVIKVKDKNRRKLRKSNSIAK